MGQQEEGQILKKSGLSCLKKLILVQENVQDLS